MLLTGARSAVGRLIAKVLTERGVRVTGLVRSEAGAATLASALPGSPVFATEAKDWKGRVRAAAEGAQIHVAIDSVGGRLLGDVADLLAEGRDRCQFRLAWRRDERHSPVSTSFPDAQRRGARQLDAAAGGAAQSRHCGYTEARARARTLFEVAERYPPSRIADAVAHVSQAGRDGVVLIDFSKD